MSRYSYTRVLPINDDGECAVLHPLLLLSTHCTHVPRHSRRKIR
jgi:hypothetical protein